MLSWSTARNAALWIAVIGSNIVGKIALAESVRGTWQGHGFYADVSDDESRATIVWDDGATGVTLLRNYNPNPRPRCFCDVYEAGSRRLLIETSGDGRKTAIYSNSEATGPTETVKQAHGEWNGYGFWATIRNIEEAKITWDDGTPGVTLPRDHSVTFRCSCYLFRAGQRSLMVEMDMLSGEIEKLTYSNGQ